MTLLDIVAGVIVGVSFPFVVLALTAFVTGIRRGRTENRERRKRDRDRRIAALERELGLADPPRPIRPPAGHRVWHYGDELAPWEAVVYVIGGDPFVVNKYPPPAGPGPDVPRG